MPTNLLSFVLFVFLIAPGLVAFTWRAFRPTPPATVLTELAGFIFRSLVCNGLALLVFVGVRAVWPRRTPDVGALVRTPGPYLRDHYALVSTWAVVLLVIACSFAYLGARLHARAVAGSGWLSKLLQKAVPGTAIAMLPAWWELFLAVPDKRCYVACVLDDGTYLAGPLHSFNPTPTESGDRDVTLADPVLYRTGGDKEMRRLGGAAGVGAVCVSAGRIQYFSVSFLDLDTPMPGSPLADSSPAGSR
jgi:hypothetical protein